ncbi:MAG: hypothetical protein FJ254_05730 [Phycisphaerae bacterium]|nr:hypothetical protein [Phycisphaerae bacterium]
MIRSIHQPCVWLGAAAALVIGGITHADGPTLVRMSAPLTDSAFGQSLAARSTAGGCDVLVAAPSANGARGIVELFSLKGGQSTRTATLQPSDLLANEKFGFAVAISDTTIAAGSPFGTGARGKVRVFARSTSGVGPAVVIESPDAALNDAFGHAVATLGDWLAVGEPLDDSAGSALDRGAVHLFRQGTDGSWSVHARIVAPDAVAGDTFGYTLAMDASTLVIASRYADVGALQQAGAVWTVALGQDGSVGPTVRVQAPDPGAYEWFGASVAIEGNTLVVGACRDTISAEASEQGTVRVFDRDGSGWIQSTMLVSPGAATQDRFGNSVAVNAGRILVGADGQDPQGVSLAGMMHLFRLGAAWTHDRAFELPNPGVNQNLGIACAMTGSLVLGGAPRHTPTGGLLREGAVGVWSLAQPCAADLDGNGAVSGADLGLLLTLWNSVGSADLNGDGIVDAADLGALLAAWGPCGP